MKYLSVIRITDTLTRNYILLKHIYNKILNLNGIYTNLKIKTKLQYELCYPSNINC